jgi:endoglucanase
VKILIKTCLLLLLVATAGGRSTAGNPPGEARTFMRGVSIAHWLAKVYDPAGPGAPWFQKTDVQWIADQGFDHIRFPLDGRWVWRADGTLDKQRLAPLVRALQRTRDAGLGAVIDMHFLPGGTYDKDVQDTAVFTDDHARREAARFWKSFAERFGGEGPYLRFELIKRAHGSDERAAERPERGAHRGNPVG